MDGRGRKNRGDVCFTWWVNNQTVVGCVTSRGDWIRLLQNDPAAYWAAALSWAQYYALAPGVLDIGKTAMIQEIIELTKVEEVIYGSSAGRGTDRAVAQRLDRRCGGQSIRRR